MSKADYATFERTVTSEERSSIQPFANLGALMTDDNGALVFVKAEQLMLSLALAHKNKQTQHYDALSQATAALRDKAGESVPEVAEEDTEFVEKSIFDNPAERKKAWQWMINRAREGDFTNLPQHFTDHAAEEFKALILDDRALHKLARAAEDVRTILIKYSNLLGKNQKQRLGQCSIANEINHGMNFAIKDFASYEEHPTKTLLTDCMETLFNTLSRPSLLSKKQEKISKELYNDENALNAIPRAIQDAKDWAEGRKRLKEDDRKALEQHLEEAAVQFGKIEAFVRKYNPGARLG